MLHAHRQREKRNATIAGQDMMRNPKGDGKMNKTFDNKKTFPGFDDIRVKMGLHYNGWIYYKNPLMGECLYRAQLLGFLGRSVL